MIIKENYCVGCETCVNCGRREDVTMRVCDECETSDGTIYRLDDGSELCRDCLLKAYEGEFKDFVDIHFKEFIDWLGVVTEELKSDDID